MARASKLGADAATRDANRSRSSGHLCTLCEKPIRQGELLVVNVVEFADGRTRRRNKVPYHRTCYKTD
jgi:hypothetical protein